METEAAPRFSRAEVDLAGRVGQILAPTIRDILGKHQKAQDDKIAAFCNTFSATRAALDALSVHSSPTARVELELRLVELAQRFVDEHSPRA